jgi:hypothetical protein
VSDTPPGPHRATPPGERGYDDPGGQPEVELPRGDVTEAVVRVGETVRRPHQPQSLAVARYLDRLEAVGFEGSPRYLGRDQAGRDVLTYLDGAVAGDPPEPWAADDGLLASVGHLVRRLHEASAGYAADRGFAAPDGAIWGRDQVTVEVPGPPLVPELVSHNDVTPQNVVVRDGVAVGLIDFDLAGPTSRLLEVFNTAMHWVPLRAPEDVWPTAAERPDLVDVGLAHGENVWLRMRAAAEQLGGGWARMWDEGVGEAIRRRQAWLRSVREALLDALTAGSPLP